MVSPGVAGATGATAVAGGAGGAAATGAGGVGAATGAGGGAAAGGANVAGGAIPTGGAIAGAATGTKSALSSTTGISQAGFGGCGSVSSPMMLFPPYATTRSTSSIDVSPMPTFAQPSWRSVSIPSATATRPISALEA